MNFLDETTELKMDMAQYDPETINELFYGTIATGTSSSSASRPSEANFVATGKHQTGRSGHDEVEFAYMSVSHRVPWECFQLADDIDRGCATLDTGCQRMAIGLKTLRSFETGLPQELPIRYRQEIHHFRSVHQVSATSRIALIPTSLGPRGSVLKPAVFEDDYSASAPFLLSLPFMLHCGAILALDESRGLFLVSSKYDFKVRCHLGPTGALRIPLQDFDSTRIKHLLASHGDSGSEYELLECGVEPRLLEPVPPRGDSSPLGHAAAEVREAQPHRPFRSDGPDELAPSGDSQLPALRPLHAAPGQACLRSYGAPRGADSPDHGVPRPVGLGAVGVRGPGSREGVGEAGRSGVSVGRCGPLNAIQSGKLESGSSGVTHGSELSKPGGTNDSGTILDRREYPHCGIGEGEAAACPSLRVSTSVQALPESNDAESQPVLLVVQPASSRAMLDFPLGAGSKTGSDSPSGDQAGGDGGRGQGSSTIPVDLPSSEHLAIGEQRLSPEGDVLGLRQGADQ